MSIFKKPSNYFLSISFQWKDIYKILEIPKEEQTNFVISENYYYESLNANSNDGLGINTSSAIFEYYIIPDSLRNGNYNPSSSIFDQQLKRFFESPNINYGVVLKSIKPTDSLICLFNKNVVNGKAGFAVHLSREKDRKTIIFLFDEHYLNLNDAHTKWGEKIAFETYEISFDPKNENVVKEISISPDTVYIGISIQSQDDAQSSPLSQDLFKYFKNKTK